MTKSRFPDAPPQIASLPVEARGYPVPYFVETIDGEPDFRVVDPRKIERGHKLGLCWICGRKIAGLKAFVIGPMCAVNRVAPEPPSHPDCARFAATSCPFLSRPLAKRRPRDDGGKHKAPAGIMIERNPGVTLVWLTRSYRTQRERNGLLFKIGPPERVEWFCEGRAATHDEVMESIRTGLPILAKVAHEDGPEAVALLATLTARAVRLIPRKANG